MSSPSELAPPAEPFKLSATWPPAVADVQTKLECLRLAAQIASLANNEVEVLAYAKELYEWVSTESATGLRRAG